MDENRECQSNPTLAISDSRHNISDIRTLIRLKMPEKKDLIMQYSVPYKWPYWLFVSVLKIMLVEYLERHLLIKHPNNLRRWFIPLQRGSSLCQPLWMVGRRVHNPVNHRHRDVWSIDQTMQDSDVGHSWELMEFTNVVIIASRNRIRLPWVCDIFLP